MTMAGRCYEYQQAGFTHSRSYQRQYLGREITKRNWPASPRALDYGCGNGSITGWLVEKGFTALGVDISASGIAVAKRTIPGAEFSNETSLEAIAPFGPFDLVICIEALAHCFEPARELKKFFDCMQPGGTLLISTPYHGYVKNLAMAVTGHLEKHLDTLWNGAYVHFFNIDSITQLVKQAGFVDVSIARVGRIPPLAQAMILTCTRPTPR